MKKYTLSATGNVRINSYGRLEVGNVNLLGELVNSLGIEKESYSTKQFAGKIEITITDLTEPLVIDTDEDEEDEDEEVGWQDANFR